MIVAIEGVDGSGKTTQASLLTIRLKKNGYKVVYIQPVYFLLDFLGFGSLKEHIASLFSPRKTYLQNHSKRYPLNVKKLAISVLGFFYAYVSYILIRLHYKNAIVVCDRYFYQFFFDLFGEGGGKLLRRFPKPDVIFFLDGELDRLYRRMKKCDMNLDKSYYERVYTFYKVLEKEHCFITLNAFSARDVINREILKWLLVRMHKKK